RVGLRRRRRSWPSDEPGRSPFSRPAGGGRVFRPGVGRPEGGLGMPHAGRVFLGTAAVLLVVAVPLLYSSHQQTHLRNFRVVEDGVLYRSGQLSRSGFERVLRDYRIRTVITLRTSRVPGVPPPDSWEEGVCAAQPVPVRHVRIVPRVWSPDETGGVPAEEGIKDFLAVMDDP